jgi:hypothetical protein
MEFLWKKFDTLNEPPHPRRPMAENGMVGALALVTPYVTGGRKFAKNTPLSSNRSCIKEWTWPHAFPMEKI